MLEFYLKLFTICCLYCILYLICNKSTLARYIIILFGVIIIFCISTILIFKISNNPLYQTIIWALLSAFGFVIYSNFNHIYEYINIFAISNLLRGINLSEINRSATQLLEKYK